MDWVQERSAVAPPIVSKTSCCDRHEAFEILHDCHEHILERLARLETVARDLQRTGDIEERHLATLCDVLTFLDVALPMHSADEEETLFAQLREVVGPANGHTPMDCMEQEHAQHRAALAALKRAVVRRDARGVARCALALDVACREHIAKEEEVLYPWARKTLTDPAVVATMTEQMRERRVAAGLLGC